MGKLSLLSSIFIITLFLASCGGSSEEKKGVVNPVTDTDGDGIDDFEADSTTKKDLCSPSKDGKFVSTPITDHDRDGCKDDGEDPDDDNDNKKDAVDDCEKSPKGFLSGDRTTDYDDDGCKDDDPEDPDDDNDTVNDFEVNGTTEKDKCRTSETSGFISVSTSNNPAAINDYDGDGCEDAGEDEDDDDDTVNDFEADGTTEKDNCRTSKTSGFISVSTSNNPLAINDYDGDGCEDAGEDKDDDDDTVNDFEADGTTEKDKCRTSETSGFISVSTSNNPLDINDYDGDGCEDAGEDKDDDDDGVADFEANGTTEKDKCPLVGFTTDNNGDGCEDTTTDSDGDTVFDDSDRCITSETSGFISVSTSNNPLAINDYDGDGCEDAGEDKDDDDDGVADFEANGTTEKDKCPLVGFTTDNNGDGCEDTTTDSDGDTVFDDSDRCITSKTSSFISVSTSNNPLAINDYDGDGCEDAGEDKDDDDDTVNDFEADGTTEKDKCRTSETSGFISVSTSNNPLDINDYDGDGCEDAGEDEDDDDDTVNDFKADGTTEKDNCRTSETSGFISVSTSNNPLDINDYDGDGCEDAGEDKDDNNNGLMEIATADELGNIRYSLDGTRYGDGSSSSDAGCPTINPVGCIGYELANDIDLLSVNFEPITGNFTAILEGNNKTISNLVIVTDANTKNAGFFISLASGSTVRNLSFATGSVTSNYVGGTQNSPNFVGVLAAGNVGVISDVSITGISVTTGDGDYDRVGGLVGGNINTGTIQDSSSAAVSVTGGAGSDQVGGLVGSNIGTIQDSSSAAASVTGGAGSDQVGGLVGGNIDTGIIQDSSSAADSVAGGADTDYVGGLVGSNYHIIQSSSATGNAYGGAGGDQVGGLVGSNAAGGIIRNSYATGDADGNDNDPGIEWVGGLVGSNYNIIQDSYATGDAYGSENNDYVGGLVGGIISGSIKNSYVLGNVDGGGGNDHVGYLVGWKYAGTIAANYYYGDIMLNNGETVFALNDDEVKIKTSDNLKDLTAIISEGDFGTGKGFSTKNWDFGSTSQYPSLKSYNSTAGEGTLLCGQLPEADFVQCPPTP